MSNIVTNHLINTKSLIYFDEKTNSDIELTIDNIYNYYNFVFVLCKKDNQTIPLEFYNLEVSSDIVNKTNNNLVIHKVSNTILKNINHFNQIVILSDEQLTKYNIFNYELATKNIVIPILNIYRFEK